ncbi:MAG: hypothetical protein GF350_09640 [Chitinivibrionales bacterium]|nr:hypothetical protein [Chitinivibrionales bacterium]
MQKLVAQITVRLKNSSASAMVGVVSLIIIMAFGATALLQVATTSSLNEAESFRDTQAFLAAESGLLLGAGFAKFENDVDTEFPDPGDSIYLFQEEPIFSHFVDVIIECIIEDTCYRMISEVFDSADFALHDETTFRIRLVYDTIAKDNINLTAMKSWRQEYVY